MYVARRRRWSHRGFDPAPAAIRTAHQPAGVALDLQQPRLRMTLERVMRSRGVRPTRRRLRCRTGCKNAGRQYPPPSRRSASPASCCCSVLAPRYAAPNWSGYGSATPSWPPVVTSPSWCAAGRPTNTEGDSRSRSGPTRRTPSLPRRGGRAEADAARHRARRLALLRGGVPGAAAAVLSLSKEGRLFGPGVVAQGRGAPNQGRRPDGRAGSGAPFGSFAVRRAGRSQAPDPAQVH